MLKYALLIVIGYIIGGIPFSYIVSKAIGGIDIREHGSKNSGATNVFRVLGLKAGLLAFAGDFIKGFAIAMIVRHTLGPNEAIIASMATIFGHCYSVYLNFRGGKGVATSAGMIFGLSPLIGLCLLVVQFTIIFTTGYMSLASILAGLLFPVFAWIFNMPTLFTYCSIVIGLFVVYRHKANLLRLIKGTEGKIIKKNK